MNSVHEYAQNLKERSDELIENSVRKLQDRKRIIHNDTNSPEVSNRLKQAVAEIAKAVTVTLGPKGHNVMFEINGTPITTKDGVTVTKQLLPVEDPIKNMAIQLVIQAAENTADIAGDGTTTTVALTNALVQELVGNPEVTNTTHKEVKEALAFAVTLLKKEAKKINKVGGLKHIHNIAYTSSNNNTDIANKIKKVYETIQDWNTEVNFTTTTDSSDRIELIEGYKFEHRSPSVKDKKIIVDNPYLVLCNFKITDWNNLMKNAVINYGANNTPVIFVVRDYAEDMPKLLKEHSDTYRVPMYMVRIDTFGSQMDRQFLDLSLNDEDYILTELPQEVSRGDIPWYYNGIKQAVFTPEASYLMYHDQDAKFQREVWIPELEKQAKQLNDEVEKSLIATRIKKLRGVTCNYYIGGTTASEANEKYFRIEDAILAVRSAIKYGVLPGGGIVYHKIADTILDRLNFKDKYGAKVFANALKEPLKIMARTAGISFEDMERSFKNTNYQMYYNFSEDMYQEVAKSNIYDSAKTATCSIENAVSIALTMLSTNSIIYTP